MNQPPKIVRCEACGDEELVSKLTHMRELRGKVKQYYLRCRKCGLEVHAFYMTTSLEIAQKEVEQARARFQAKPKSQALYNRFRRTQVLFGRQFQQVQDEQRRIDELLLQSEN